MDNIKQAVNIAAPKRDVVKVDLFGSYARGTATEKSDLDFLVDFGRIPSIFQVMGLKAELEELLGCSVDVVRAPLPNPCPISIDRVVAVYEQS